MQIDASTLISAIDLTDLSGNEDQALIESLCRKGLTPMGPVAAICIFPHYIKCAKAVLSETPMISLATVANFPSGRNALSDTMIEIEQALVAGADEIDLVIPYEDYLEGNTLSTRNLVKAAKGLCASHTLKIILETGALSDEQRIYHASCTVLEAGADFIKTSTGKISVGATLSAASTMLRAIRNINIDAGFKASGGIKTPEQAQAYLNLAQEVMPSNWVQKKHFRIGASTLLDALVAKDNDDRHTESLSS